MPKELTLLEEFDVIAELQFPDFAYSTESFEDKIAFCNFINKLPERRLLLLDDDLFNLPFVFAGLQEIHIEHLLKDGGYILKKILYVNIADTDFFNEMLKFVSELDSRNKTTENSTRIKNIVQYLKDNKHII